MSDTHSTIFTEILLILVLPFLYCRIYFPYYITDDNIPVFTNVFVPPFKIKLTNLSLKLFFTLLIENSIQNFGHVFKTVPPLQLSLPFGPFLFSLSF